ncbi:MULTISPECIES: non-ribosomal peptide synthetase [unclassified Bradyrhizobium]|uniref:non-ribosomal peptide synthetase n=1 Tax=unclassified Bradyrhizobium TaxID=2631580 RepID=UPI002916584B|nr:MULTISPECIES: non-ribosomal peptide synthetase [unclassified Bradyrhizobium]
MLEVNAERLTLSDVLRFRVERDPHRVAFRFAGGGPLEKTLTYSQIHERACALRLALHERGVREGPVAIFLPNGPEFVWSFFGVLYAGCIPAPLYSSRAPGALFRSQNILSDLCPNAVLYDSRESIGVDVLDSMRSIPQRRQLLIDVNCIEYVDALSGDQYWSGDPNSLALIQYTSGSTALPRGVKISHRNLVHNVSSLARSSGLDGQSVGVSWLPFSHDMGLIGGIIAPLYVGFPATLLNPALFLTRPIEWLRAISRHRATVSGGPNFGYDRCARKLRPDQIAELDLSSWSTAYTGAEAVRADTIELFAQTFEQCGFRREAFFPCYGLAEATLIVCGGPCGGPMIVDVDRDALRANSRAIPPSASEMTQRLVSSGRPVEGQSVVIRDVASKELCSDNEVGEIWVSGPSVASGYWGKLPSSDDGFMLSANGEHRIMLKTGDLGFVRNRHLFIVGRSKDLIIIHGVNHYPEDIEQTAERSHRALHGRSGAVFAVEIAQQDHLIIVQEIGRRSAADAEAILAAIRRDVSRLHGLVVRQILLVDRRAIPKTTSGKIQRHAVRAAFLAGQLPVLARWRSPDESDHSEEIDVGFESVQTSINESRRVSRDEIVESICSEVSRVCNLRREEVFGNRSPFEYGIDSIRIMELRAALINRFEVPIELPELFECNSIAELGSQLASRLAARRQASVENHSLDVFFRSSRPVGANVPLSFAQERLWFLDQLESLGSTYNIVSGLHLAGPLDRTAVQSSLASLFLRHQILRTRFPLSGGIPTQVVDDGVSPDLNFIDLSDLTPEAKNIEIARCASALGQWRFNLEHGRLARFELIALGNDNHALLCAMHHIIADAWSMNIFIEEFGDLYAAHRAGRPPELLDLDVQYADYACWQRGHVNEVSLEEGLKYWCHVLEGAPQAINLPTDRARPLIPTFSGESVAFVVDSIVSSKLAITARREGATLFMVLASALQILLARWSGQEDVVIGFPIAGRTVPDFKRLIGLFLNMLPLRTKILGNPAFVEVLQEVKRASLGAYSHQEVPFEKIVRSLRPTRDPSRHPIFQVMINSWQLTKPNISIDSLVTKQLEFEESNSKFDLSFYFLEAEGGEIQCRFTFNSNLFERCTIERLVGCFGLLLRAVAENPKERFWHIPLVEIDEARRWTARWSAPDCDQPRDLCIHELFANQVAKTPDVIAVLDDCDQLTYAELDSQSDRLAYHLRTLGVGPEMIVGLCLDRSIGMVIGVLAILKAGAAYLPLEPNHPPARIQYMLNDSGARVVITETRHVEALRLRHLQTICLDRNWDISHAGYSGRIAKIGSPENLACIIYTSGSTGRPKGVMVEHRQIINYTYGISRKIPIAELNRFAMVQSLMVGSAISALYPPLLFGKSLHLISREKSLDANGCAAYLNEKQIDCLKIAPSHLAALVRESQTPGHLMRRVVIVAGEPSPTSWVSQWKALNPECLLLNHYGATETTIGVLAHPVCVSGSMTNVPLGRPLQNSDVYILDRFLNPMPVGSVGEIYVSGHSITRGYLGHPGNTAERFVPNPFGERGDRLYRTGDIGRWRQDGTAEYLGRQDNQVKIRGFRIELGEVEAALASFPAIQQARVLMRQSPLGDPMMVAYVVSAASEEQTRRPLNEYLRARLPEHMLPPQIAFLESLPRTEHGKLDLLALPNVEPGALKGSVGPQIGLEQEIAALWSEVLGIENVGAEDNFFDLGGHSLLLVHVHSRCSDLFHRKIPITALFHYPTVRALARYIEGNAESYDLDESVRRGEKRRHAFNSKRARISTASNRAQHDR